VPAFGPSLLFGLGEGTILPIVPSARTNGTMSCGPRLVSQLPSCTTVSSTQVAPALTMSSRTPGQDVMRRPE
jgi:hypothetical protein